MGSAGAGCAGCAGVGDSWRDIEIEIDKDLSRFSVSSVGGVGGLPLPKRGSLIFARRARHRKSQSQSPTRGSV